MKDLLLKFKRTIIVVAIIVVGQSNMIDAQVLIDGIYYTLSSSTASVAENPDGTKYSGDVVVPTTITYNGASYNVTGISSNAFKNCPNLTSLTLGDQYYRFTGVQGCTSLKSFVWNYSATASRSISMGLSVSTTNSNHFFYGCDEIETIVMPGYGPNEIPKEAFWGFNKLKRITIPANCTKICERAFYSCDSLQIINLENVTSVGDYAFYWCNLKNIDLSNVTFIGDWAFCDNFNLTNVIMPESMTDGSLGQAAFYCCSFSSFKLPKGITKIPKDFFYICDELTSVDIPASVTHIEDGAFGICNKLPTEQIMFEGLEYLGHDNLELNRRSEIKSVTLPSTLSFIGCNNLYPGIEVKVAQGNKNFKMVGNILYSADGKTLYVMSEMPTEPFSIEDNKVETVWSHAFYKCPLTHYNFPNLKEVKVGAFNNTGLTEVIIKKGVKYAEESFELCSSLSSVTIEEGVEELSAYCFHYCQNLTTSPTIPSSLTKLGIGSFTCCGFNSIKLGKEFKHYGAAALSRYVSEDVNPDFTLELMSAVPPMCDSTYIGYDGETSTMITSWNNTLKNVTLIVPASSVEAYKAHAKWKYCKEIVGNSEWAGIKEKQSLPGGLYFAVKDGNICYLQGGRIHDTGINAGAHPFNIQVYNNAIYIADAGEQYYYQSTGRPDGSLKKIELFDNTYGITNITNNANSGNPFQDPLTCWVDQSAGELYVGDRSTGIGRIPLNTDAYYSTQIPLSYLTNTFIYNWNRLPYYSKSGLVYGAICKGIQKDKKGIYWCAFDYNGYGIYRFKESDIYSSSSEANAAATPYPVIANGARLTSIYLDEVNGYLYGYFYGNSSQTGIFTGLYRISIAEAEAGGDGLDGWELIDNSPAAPLNETADERVYTRQITGDGTNVYWSYIAAEDADPKNNPLHRNGIKMIPATGTPTVSYVLPDVEVYGLAPYNYDFVDVEDVYAPEDNVNVVIANKTLTAMSNCNVNVYSSSGIDQLNVELQMGEQISLELASGIYIVKATNKGNGSTQTSKFVVK